MTHTPWHLVIYWVHIHYMESLFMVGWPSFAIQWVSTSATAIPRCQYGMPDLRCNQHFCHCPKKSCFCIFLHFTKQPMKLDRLVRLILPYGIQTDDLLFLAPKFHSYFSTSWDQVARRLSSTSEVRMEQWRLRPCTTRRCWVGRYVWWLSWLHACPVFFWIVGLYIVHSIARNLVYMNIRNEKIYISICDCIIQCEPPKDGPQDLVAAGVYLPLRNAP